MKGDAAVRLLPWLVLAVLVVGTDISTHRGPSDGVGAVATTPEGADGGARDPQIVSSSAAATPGSASGPVPSAYPNAASTGVPIGTALRTSGPVRVTEPGTVIDSRDISGTVTIEAANVTIRRSKIHGTGTWYGVYVKSGNVTIYDTEIYGFANGIAFHNWRAYRINVHSMTQDGVKLGSDVSIEDSWIHGMTPEDGAHADGMQMQAGSERIIVRHNNIDCRSASGGSLGNAAVFLKPDFGSGLGPVLVEGNLLAGGNYTLYAIDYNANTQRGVTIRNNVWVKGSWRYGPRRATSVLTEWNNNRLSDGTALAEEHF